MKSDQERREEDVQRWRHLYSKWASGDLLEAFEDSIGADPRGDNPRQEAMRLELLRRLRRPIPEK